MIDAGITQADFAERIGLSERSIEKWRAPGALGEGSRGPGLVHVIRALHALGLKLDVQPRKRRNAITLDVRNRIDAVDRDRRRRNETPEQWQARHDRTLADARRKGLLTDDEDRNG